MTAKAYAIYCIDKPGTQQQRRDASPAHLTHVENMMDNYLVAGPLRNEEGETIGSLLIVKAKSAADARKQIEADPYFHAGFWQDIQVADFMPAAGDWVGGKNW